MQNILDHFRLNKEKEGFDSVVETIYKGVVFRGTNLWILIFAIFVASLGLNVNSTSVIIGAMLISPLMGPIMGVGLGMGINDVVLIRKSVLNLLFAAGVGLATSTLFFLVSPINDAHSEILARTSPNIYDVLIAFYGGLAGIIATSSKQKGNVLTGVAIATALMPPLCTAGYGLATLQLNYFFGAIYLFLINAVFIALATLVGVRFLKFPQKQFVDKKIQNRTRYLVSFVTAATLFPSIYFGYNLIVENNFIKQANSFIEKEAVFPDDYLLKKNIDPKNKKIVLIYGGKKIEEHQIDAVKNKLADYQLSRVKLEIKQGFAFLNEEENIEKQSKLNEALEVRLTEVRMLQAKIDSAENEKILGKQVFKELKIQYPEIESASIQPNDEILKAGDRVITRALVLLKTQKKFSEQEKNKIQSWVKTRMNKDSATVIISNK